MDANNNYTWGIVTPIDLLAMLKEDYEEFKKDYLSERKALHCILTGWHLTDWLYENYGKKHFKGIGSFRESLYPECPELKLLHDLTTRMKHFTVGRPKVDVKNTSAHNGAFSSSFSPSFNISCLKISYDNKEESINQILERVLKFWDDYFKNISLKDNL